jgi:hypothetical protein
MNFEPRPRRPRIRPALAVSAVTVGLGLIAVVVALLVGKPHGAVRGSRPSLPLEAPESTTVAPVSDPALVVHAFPASLFNQGDVQAWPLDPANSTMGPDVASDEHNYYGDVNVNTEPDYTVPADQPTVTVTVQAGCGDFTVNTGTQIPIPAYAATYLNGDSPLAIYQPSTHTAWELWQARPQTNGTWSACWGGKLDTNTSNGVYQNGYGRTATGISLADLDVTEADIASGHIDHAIAIDLPRCNGYTYPANRGDCGNDPGQPAEGQTFRFPANTNCATQTPLFAQLVCQAGVTYGFVDVDYAGAVAIQAEDPRDWRAEDQKGVDPITRSWAGKASWQVITDLPWSTVQVVDPPVPN